MIIMQSSNIIEVVECNSSNKQKIKSAKKKEIEKALIAYKKNIIENSDFGAYKRKQLGRRYN